MNTQVPAAAKAGRQDQLKKKTKMKVKAATRNTSALRFTASHGERGKVNRSTRTAPSMAHAQAIPSAAIGARRAPLPLHLLCPGTHPRRRRGAPHPSRCWQYYACAARERGAAANTHKPLRHGEPGDPLN